MRTEKREISVAEPLAVVSPSPRDTTVSSVPAGILPTGWRVANRYAIFSSLAVAALYWDLWSKWAVFDWLKAPGQKPIWSGTVLGMSVDFQLATTFNRGALWGIGQDQTWLFASLSIVAVVAISYFLWNRQAVSSLWLTIVSALLLAGTLGNLYDRLGLHGWKNDKGQIYAVRDFLDFVFFGKFEWATFNFADTYLVTGAIMLVIHSFWTANDAPVPAKSTAAPQPS